MKSQKDKPPKRVEKVRKLKEVARDDFHGDDFFAEFAAEAKGVLKDDIIVPSSAEDSLLEVAGWIDMPDEVKHVMDAPGVPCGLITTVYGLPDCGKTTFANTAFLNTQKDKGIAILFKTEDKYSLKRAGAMGIDVKKMVIFRPKTIEQVGDHVHTVVNIIKKRGWEHRKITIVWDSLAATMSKAETNENRKEFSMDAAKAIRGMLRRVSADIKESNIAFIIVNQVYDNMNMFGEKTTMYGGKGPIYHSAIMLKFAKIGRIRPRGKKDGDFCGITTKVEVQKNHLGQPFKTGEFEIDWRGFVGDERSPEYAPSYLAEEAVEKEEDDAVAIAVAEGKKTDEPESSDDVPAVKKKRVKKTDKAGSAASV